MSPGYNTDNTDSMDIISRLLELPGYKLALADTSQREKERRFCCHDSAHLWETARVAYILFLTGEVPCPELMPYDDKRRKEIIYAAALVHDIARYKEYDDPRLCHAAESAVMARPLLVAAGFSAEEISIIDSAVANHRKEGYAGFDLLLYRADKESRPCAACPVLGECKKFQNGRRPHITF